MKIFRLSFKLIVFLLFVLFIIKTGQNKKTGIDYTIDYFPQLYDALSVESMDECFYKLKFLDQNVPIQNTWGIDELNIFISLSNKRDFKLTEMLIQRAIQNGELLERYLENFEFRDFFSSNYGKNLIDDYNNRRRLYLKRINLELRNKLISMSILDQKYRPFSSKENAIKQAEIDSANCRLFVQIISEVGFPTESIIGKKNIDNHDVIQKIDFMIRHFSHDSKTEVFFPTMIECIKSGECPPMIYANLKDLDLIREMNKEQKYGTFYSHISDTLKVDSSRKSIGLPSFLQEKKIKYNDVYWGK